MEPSERALVLGPASPRPARPSSRACTGVWARSAWSWPTSCCGPSTAGCGWCPRAGRHATGLRPGHHPGRGATPDRRRRRHRRPARRAGRLIFDNGSGKGDSVDVVSRPDFAPARASSRSCTRRPAMACRRPAVVDAGFDAACGAIGSCANGPVEYPQVLSMWSHGHTFRSGEQGRRPFDAEDFRRRGLAVRLPRRQQRQGDKGDLTTTIDSVPIP